MARKSRKHLITLVAYFDVPVTAAAAVRAANNEFGAGYAPGTYYANLATEDRDGWGEFKVRGGAKAEAVLPGLPLNLPSKAD